MLQGSTLCSGIIAGRDTPYKFLTVDLPCSAPLRDQGLCHLAEGVLRAPSPPASSPRRSSSSFPFGRTCLRSSPFAFGPSGAPSSPSRIASPFRSAPLLAFEYLRRRAKVASPTHLLGHWR